MNISPDERKKDIPLSEAIRVTELSGLHYPSSESSVLSGGALNETALNETATDADVERLRQDLDAYPADSSAHEKIQQILQQASASGPSTPRDAGASTPTAKILADQGPTTIEKVATSDALKRAKITRSLTQLVLRMSPSDTIGVGLFGHWGSGKSSQIEFVKAALLTDGSRKVRIAEFNAWEHEKIENQAAALAQAVVEGLLRETGFWAQLKLAIELSRERKSRLMRKAADGLVKRRAYLLAGFKAVLPLLSTLLFSFGIFFFIFSKLITHPADWLSGFWAWMTSIPASLATTLGAAHLFVSGKLTDWFKRMNAMGLNARTFALPDYSQQLGSLHEIRRTLKDLCKLQLGRGDSPADSGEYLFLVVDDLDRCSPEAVKKVFDAVRMVANIPRVVTVVAIDERIAFAAVAKHYDQFGYAGRTPELVARDFLAKVFQVSMILPPITSDIAKDYIHKKLFASTQIDTGGNYGGQTTPEGPPAPDLLDALPEEVELFSEMAHLTGISNPRELWRMKQAWSMLRGLALDDGAGYAKIEPLLRALFVREWWQQASPLQRQQMANRREPSLPHTSDLTSEQLRLMELDKELSSLYPQIDMVLLPCAPDPVPGLVAGQAPSGMGVGIAHKS
jgi:hypothetical protein